MNKFIEIVPNYCINKKGEIKNLKTKRILKFTISHNGYFKTNVMINGKITTIFPHRLVAQAFIPNPNNLPCVNHKDGNKQNNCVDNLEWCSYSENMKHAVKNGLLVNKGKSVLQKDLKGNVLARYKSCREASKQFNPKNNSSIWKVCVGQMKTYKGYIWEFE